MRRHLVDKPGLHCGERSSAEDAESGIAGRPLADVALFALVGLTLDVLGSATAWLDDAAFERYCRVVDGSGISATVQLIGCFGPAVWLLLQDGRRIYHDPRLRGWSRGGWLVLDGAALAHVAVYVLLLRLPWLAEQVTAHGRADLWSARLSETVEGVPLTAFAVMVGSGMLFVAVGAATLRAIRRSGLMQRRDLALRFSVSVGLVCSIDCALAMLTLITFATGGLF